MRKPLSYISFLLFLTTFLKAQEGHIGRLIDGELRMTFPSIYFKHNSTDYAAMPYSVDSCYKYIVKNAKDISDYAIWRDSSETEALTNQRIKKIHAELKKYKMKGRINIENMHEVQKISSHTINLAKRQTQTDYLLCLNSTFEIAKIKEVKEFNQRQPNHVERPRIWCSDCWRTGFHTDKKSRDLRRIYRRNRKNKKEKDKAK